MTLTPSDAAALSFALTAIMRRPTRDLRTLPTTTVTASRHKQQKIAYRPGVSIGSIESPNSLGDATVVPPKPPV